MCRELATHYSLYLGQSNTTYGVEVVAYSIITDDPGRCFSAPTTRQIIRSGTSSGNPAPSEVSISCIYSHDNNEMNNDSNARQIILTRSGTTSAALTVPLDISGVAEDGVDYEDILASAVIPAGQSQVQIPIVGIADAIPEGNEDIFVTVGASSAVAPWQPQAMPRRIAVAGR